MSAYTLDCPPLDACGPCGTLPPGFVRLRYFFGKRMGVADFVDEQRFHAGKMRFHNQRLHGAGLLCGLRVDRQSATDVILRVGKGAAMDPCGREIVVGYDQCIDLDAWFQRLKEERRVTEPTWPAVTPPVLDADGELPLIVAIRYAECGSGPEPAPRDPCSCDAASCDFGRIREEFELGLFLPGAPELVGALPLVPARTELGRAIGRAFGASSLGRGLADAAMLACADPDPAGWLILAELQAELGADAAGVDRVVGIVEGSITGRASLLAETALLQELVLRQIGAQLDAAALVGGPELVGLTLARVGADDELSLWLSSAVVASTVPPATAFALHRLDPTAATAWSPAIAVTVDASEAAAATAPRIKLRVAAGGLVETGLYRLTIAVPPATPIVDADLRVLAPTRPQLQFAVGVDPATTALVLTHPPYAR